MITLRKSVFFLLNKKHLNAITLLLSFIVLTSLSSAQTNKKVIVPPDSLNKNGIKRDSTVARLTKPSTHIFKSTSLLTKGLTEFQIDRSFIEALDYRFTGDLLIDNPFSFSKKLGYNGLPSETMIYGHGNGSVLFFNDGIELNNRLYNSFDLNLLQSESIDSIEVIPLSRAFLLGNSGIASINFIPKEPPISKPYSRIKYYQAPNDEAFADGIFSINPFKKTNVYFEITNQSNGLRYKNSDLTNWLAEVRLNYFLSNEINLRLSYKHASSKVQLNGGVDTDSIGHANIQSQFDNIVYDNISAPVRFTNRYSTSILNNIVFTSRMRFWENAPSEFSIYSNDFLSEYRQNISGIIQDKVFPISRDNGSQTIGVKFRQEYSSSFININANTFIERSSFKIDQHSIVQQNDSIRIATLNGKSQNTFAASILTTFNLLDGNFTPSLYAKYLSRDHQGYTGIGADFSFRITDVVKLFCGISQFEKPISSYQQDLFDQDKSANTQKIQSAEARIFYSTTSINLSLGYFISKNNNEVISAFAQSPVRNDESFFILNKKSQIQGLNFSLGAKVWKLSITSNSNYYFSDEQRIEKGLPEFTFVGGIYYIDTLFNHNLKLKSGLNFYGYGTRYQQQVDFEKNVSSSFYFDNIHPTFTNGTSLLNNSIFSPSFQVDLFVAGRIQDAAVIYFTWENLLNSKYSVVPYYPMQAQGIRFGFSWEFLD